MHEFTLKNPKKMGERDEKYGQSYWSYTHESQMPVKFNLMQGDVFDDQKIQCEEYSVKKSQKGTDYQQLKKVRVVGAEVQPKPSSTRQYKADPDKQAEIRAEWALGKASELLGLDDMDKVFEKAKQLHAMVDRLKANEPEGSAESTKQAQLDTDVDEVHEVDESEPIDLDSIPF